jgi:hypothetical protein
MMHQQLAAWVLLRFITTNPYYQFLDFLFDLHYYQHTCGDANPFPIPPLTIA